MERIGSIRSFLIVYQWFKPEMEINQLLIYYDNLIFQLYQQSYLGDPNIDKLLWGPHSPTVGLMMGEQRCHEVP